MRFVHAALLLAVSASPALAQRSSVIVIPTRPDVPVLINGVDISYAVVEGEFGLDRPGRMPLTVIYWLRPIAVPYYRPTAYRVGPAYFPRSDKKPGYGRLEVEPAPDRPLPPPAQSYRKSWSSHSDPTPPTEYAPFPAPPVGISIGGGNGEHHWHDDHEGGEGHEQGGGPGGPGGGPGGPGGGRGPGGGGGGHK
jgi:hypothetical protein